MFMKYLLILNKLAGHSWRPASNSQVHEAAVEMHTYFIAISTAYSERLVSYAICWVINLTRSQLKLSFLNIQIVNIIDRIHKKTSTFKRGLIKCIPPSVLDVWYKFSTTWMPYIHYNCRTIIPCDSNVNECAKEEVNIFFNVHLGTLTLFMQSQFFSRYFHVLNLSESFHFVLSGHLTGDLIGRHTEIHTTQKHVGGVLETANNI